MVFSGTLDSRLIPACLSEAGLSASSAGDVRAMLADLLSGRRASPCSHDGEFRTATGTVRGVVNLAILWDAVGVTIKCDDPAAIVPALEKYGRTFDPAIQEMLKGATNRSLRELDAHLRAIGAGIEELRNGTSGITPAVAQTLVDFHSASIDRVVHEEIAGLLAHPVADKSVRVMLGQFLLAQFPLPAKRTHRFVLCQALVNLAEPELGEGLAKLAHDKQFASLRGRLCEALARSGHPDAARHIAAVLEDGDDETKLCAIEALGELKASHYKETVSGYLTYQSSDKEWTRAIKKAADKALKRM